MLMTANINETVMKIKKVGGSNARVVPMNGQDAIGGLQQIEIREGNTWHAVLSGLTRKLAEDIISNATNKVILG